MKLIIKIFFIFSNINKINTINQTSKFITTKNAIHHHASVNFLFIKCKNDYHNSGSLRQCNMYSCRETNTLPYAILSPNCRRGILTIPLGTGFTFRIWINRCRLLFHFTKVNSENWYFNLHGSNNPKGRTAIHRKYIF